MTRVKFLSIIFLFIFNYGLFSQTKSYRDKKKEMEKTALEVKEWLLNLETRTTETEKVPDELFNGNPLYRVTPRESNDPSRIYKIEVIRDRLDLSKDILDSLLIDDYLTGELVHELFLTTTYEIKKKGIKHNLEHYLYNDGKEGKEILIYFLQLERDYPDSPMFKTEEPEAGESKSYPELNRFEDLEMFYKFIHLASYSDMVVINGETFDPYEKFIEDSNDYLRNVLKGNLQHQKEETPLESLEFLELKKEYNAYLEYYLESKLNLRKARFSEGYDRKKYMAQEEVIEKTKEKKRKLIKLKGKTFREAYPDALKIHGLDKLMEEIEKETL